MELSALGLIVFYASLPLIYCDQLRLVSSFSISVLAFEYFRTRNSLDFTLLRTIFYILCLTFSAPLKNLHTQTHKKYIHTYISTYTHSHTSSHTYIHTHTHSVQRNANNITFVIVELNLSFKPKSIIRN